MTDIPHTRRRDAAGSPSSRALHLLSLLQTGREWRTPELAQHLGTSERTVRRDALRLRDLGYDVRSRPGPGAGYRLHPGVKVPPLLLDADEVTTIVTSLLITEATAAGQTSAAAARVKLEQVLPPSLRRRAAATALATQVLPMPGDQVDWSVLGALSDAVAQERRASFDYTDQHGIRTRRTVHPHRHVLRSGHWYLVAHDADRDDWRTFRLDRIHGVRLVETTSRASEFPWPSVDAWLGADFGRQGAHA